LVLAGLLVDELKQHQHPLPALTAAEQGTVSAVAAALSAAKQQSNFDSRSSNSSSVSNKISRNSSILHSSGSSSKVASPSEAATASQPAAAAADASTTVYIYQAHCTYWDPVTFLSSSFCEIYSIEINSTAF
jgi:hypothetical protein